MLVQIYENWNGTFGMEEDDKNRSIPECCCSLIFYKNFDRNSTESKQYSFLANMACCGGFSIEVVCPAQYLYLPLALLCASLGLPFGT